MSNNHLGLERGTVEVVAYNSAWPDLFQREKQLLEATCGNTLIAIEHIGSTAVPGLAAKPLIDMIASVRVIDDYKNLIEPLTRLGYEYMPDRVFDNRVFFPKGPQIKRTHHLSIVVAGGDGWNYPIAFREYLRFHSAARELYERRKRSLALRYPNDRALYTRHKSDVIRAILDDALKMHDLDSLHEA